jgi:hypothetical protein
MSVLVKVEGIPGETLAAPQQFHDDCEQLENPQPNWLQKTCKFEQYKTRFRNLQVFA